MHKCDICNNICKKNKFGSSVYFCKTNITCCINCFIQYKKYLNLKYKRKLLKYSFNRKIFKHNI